MVIAIKRVLFCLLLDYKKKLWNMERQDVRGDTKASEKYFKSERREQFFNARREISYLQAAM